MVELTASVNRVYSGHNSAYDDEIGQLGNEDNDASYGDTFAKCSVYEQEKMNNKNRKRLSNQRLPVLQLKRCKLAVSGTPILKANCTANDSKKEVLKFSTSGKEGNLQPGRHNDKDFNIGDDVHAFSDEENATKHIKTTSKTLKRKIKVKTLYLI